MAALAKESAEMGQMRNEQNADYRQAKADLELGRLRNQPLYDTAGIYGFMGTIDGLIMLWMAWAKTR